MKGFIVKSNGRYLVDNILTLITVLLIYFGVPLIFRNSPKTNKNDLWVEIVMLILLYFLATVLMYFVVTRGTQTARFSESEIVLGRAFKEATFSKEDVTYEITYTRSTQGIRQQAIFIKAGGRVYIFKEQQVVNYPRAIEYLKKNCKKEKIYK